MQFWIILSKIIHRDEFFRLTLKFSQETLDFFKTYTTANLNIQSHSSNSNTHNSETRIIGTDWNLPPEPPLCKTISNSDNSNSGKKS